eukprot:1679120-Pleurochrysis_carterae.AAC.2
MTGDEHVRGCPWCAPEDICEKSWLASRLASHLSRVSVKCVALARRQTLARWLMLATSTSRVSNESSLTLIKLGTTVLSLKAASVSETPCESSTCCASSSSRWSRKRRNSAASSKSYLFGPGATSRSATIGTSFSIAVIIYARMSTEVSKDRNACTSWKSRVWPMGCTGIQT